MNYMQYRELARTGDIVLFSGKGRISETIKWFSGSEWSHVGLVVRDYDDVLLWESTTLATVADLDSGMPRKGVQIVPLSARLESYDGDVAVRRAVQSLSVEQRCDLAVLRAAYKGRPYEESLCELASAAYDGPFGENTRDVSSLFCSELVAEAFIKFGWLPPQSKKPSNEYTPGDFACINVPDGTHEHLERLEA